MVVIVSLITGVGVLLLTVMTAAFRPNPALLPSEEYGSGKDVSLLGQGWRRRSGTSGEPLLGDLGRCGGLFRFAGKLKNHSQAQ